MDEQQRHAYVAEVARRIWEAEGEPEGEAERHWRMAEWLVATEIASQHLDETHRTG